MMFRTVVRHGITDEYPWPQDVAEIIQSWLRPLPERLACHNFKRILPPATRRTLEEVLQSSDLILRPDDNSDGAPMPVTDVIDTVLSSVGRARAASLNLFDQGQLHTRMSWTSLISALGMAISEDVFLAEDVPFLIPRTKEKPKPQQPTDMEEKAVILLSIFIRRRARKDMATDKCDQKPSPVASSEYHSSISVNSYLTIDVPLDAHITPGRGKRVDCCLPVVCTANEDKIEALVTSVVCQRYVWNIPLPVVGVSLSNSGAGASIVIGWSEVANNSQNMAPAIHLAHPTKSNSPLPSLGQFDLLDPTSALYFGQFILGLDHHFTFVQECSKDQQTRDFCWRLDHVDHPCISPEPKLDSPTNDKSPVENWLSGLPVARNTKRSISHRLRSMLSPMFR